MKYFIDTEFHEDGLVIDLISIAIVCEDGRELYMVSSEFNEDYAWKNPWLAENVLPQLDGPMFRRTRKEIVRAILDFIEPPDVPEFWGYFADYDWVALCQLFGKMADLPHGWPMYCRDLKQLADQKMPGVNFQKPENEHHALGDARWNKTLYEFLHAPPPPPYGVIYVTP